ncbi:uncharacterized protein LOC132263501 [Phlebotomus argentipes]|uniref:uncharacterized protein LOC132263501 n=1 Tax=Phlebotomus argentipes TaxID=94469 RepID=UPI002892AA97|nr:uncharacterized protein LOC132263501 [Phlebotomus argentipes]
MMIYRALVVPIAVALLGHFVTNGDDGTSTTTHRSVLDHVCYREENFTELEERRVTQPVRIRSHVWCLEFPPRCAHYRTEMKEIIKWQNVTKTRLVEHCCDGYEEVTEANEIICKPICPEGCRRGYCHQPGMCVCNPGCLNGGLCDSKKGECRCLPGWTGNGCELLLAEASTASTTPLKLIPVTENLPKNASASIEDLNSTLVTLEDNIEKLKQQLNTTTQSDISLMELRTPLPDIVITHESVVPAGDHVLEVGTGSEIVVLGNWDLNGTLVRNSSDAGASESGSDSSTIVLLATSVFLSVILLLLFVVLLYWKRKLENHPGRRSSTDSNASIQAKDELGGKIVNKPLPEIPFVDMKSKTSPHRKSVQFVESPILHYEDSPPEQPKEVTFTYSYPSSASQSSAQSTREHLYDEIKYPVFTSDVVHV